MNVQSLVDRFQDREILSNLDVEETKAIVDLLILTVLIDGEITEEELDWLADQWSQLPFAGDEHLEILVGEHGSETRAYLQAHFEDAEKIDAFTHKIAKSLVRQEVREASIRMIAVVSVADGLDLAESKLAYTLGDLFGYSNERIDELLSSVVS